MVVSEAAAKVSVLSCAVSVLPVLFSDSETAGVAPQPASIRQMQSTAERNKDIFFFMVHCPFFDDLLVSVRIASRTNAPFCISKIWSAIR